MAYDERLAGRVRKLLARRKDVSEKKMFGGVAFLARGRMCCGVLQEDLVVRLGRERYADALCQRHVRPMDFTGRPLTGFVYVARPGVRTDAALAQWVHEALAYVSALEGSTAAKRMSRMRRC